MTQKPSRLTALNSRIVDSIRPECRDKVERLVNDQLPISASPAEVSNLVFAIKKTHAEYFEDDQERKNEAEFPATVNHPRDVQHDGPNLTGMTAAEKLEWVGRNPAQANALLDAAKARKK